MQDFGLVEQDNELVEDRARNMLIRTMNRLSMTMKCLCRTLDRLSRTMK
jgi:hypothetical protein